MSFEFAPKPGCPMCSIVSSAQRAEPRSISGTMPEVLYRGEDLTVYRERASPVSSKGHLVIVFNLHVPSLYTLSSSDLPLLATLKSLAVTHLDPSSSSSAADLKIGFITPPFKDGKIPVTDHLHAHAYLAPADLLGWWRAFAYGPLAWYAIDDLIAEIRESSSNNRIRSGNADEKALRPIETVRDAGARTGTANGVETTEAGLASADLEAADSPARSRHLTPAHSRPQTPLTIQTAANAPQLLISPT